MEFGRTFNEARKAQGFKSQADLDMWYRAYDHTSTCPVCSRVGGYVELSDGMQPVNARCEIGLRLEREERAFHYS